MDTSAIKEDLSISYISALAAINGIGYETIRHDEDSTDGLLKKIVTLDDGRKFDAELRIQLKATSSTSQYTINGEKITYQLKAKNYNDLCIPGTSPIILGLLILPSNEEEWVRWTTDELMIKGCMYWLSLENSAFTTNKAHVTVTLEKDHVINKQTLQELLIKVAKEEEL